MIKSKLKYIVWLAAAIILGAILLPIGFIYLIGKGIYESKYNKLYKYLKNIVFEVISVILNYILRLAITIDELGNVIAGEMIEDFITSEEDTLFSHSDATISASIGQIEADGKLNNTGKKLSKVLSFVFEDNHCINSYESYKNNNNDYRN